MSWDFENILCELKRLISECLDLFLSFHLLNGESGDERKKKNNEENASLKNDKRRKLTFLILLYLSVIYKTAYELGKESNEIKNV